MPVCALCTLEVERLVKSHLVPNSMTKQLGDASGRMRVFEPQTGRRPPTHLRSGGIWDRFACDECEQMWFRDADDAFMRFKRKLDNQTTTRRIVRNPIRGLNIQDHDGDPNLVHRFALQTLLRAALSQTDYRCEEVRAFIPDLKATLQAGNTVASTWSVYLEHIPGPHAAAIRAPMYGPTDPPVVHLLLPNLAIFVAGSPRGLDPDLSSLFLESGPTVRIVHRRSLPGPYRADLEAGIAPGLAYVAEGLRRQGT